MIPQKSGIAFSLPADAFIAFARSLPNALKDASGTLLQPDAIVDFDLCWAYNFADPWGNQYELNCYAYERIADELIAKDDISPVRYWPRSLHAKHQSNAKR